MQITVVPIVISKKTIGFVFGLTCFSVIIKIAEYQRCINTDLNL